MPHHPSLNEVLEENCNGEWMSLSVEKLVIRDWADAENMKGEICNMEFSILCGPCAMRGLWMFGFQLKNHF